MKSKRKRREEKTLEGEVEMAAKGKRTIAKRKEMGKERRGNRSVGKKGQRHTDIHTNTQTYTNTHADKEVSGQRRFTTTITTTSHLLSVLEKKIGFWFILRPRQREGRKEGGMERRKRIGEVIKMSKGCYNFSFEFSFAFAGLFV